ncbi:MAG: enoyl-CoA hydratase/isomerase family protein, partial [Planctomycetota bacterium]
MADIPTIDEAAKRVWQIGMGPFLLMNVTGIPIAYHSAGTLGEKFGSFYRPAHKLKEEFESKQQWNLEGAVDELRIEAVQNRLLGVVFLVVGQLVDEGVGRIEDIDLGAKVGLRWSLGPFELMNKIGIEKSLNLVKIISQKYGLKIPRILEEQRQKKSPWQFKRVELSIKDAIATITINRPEALNALNEEVVRQLAETFTQAEQDKNVQAIVLTGKGKAFVAGADIGFFVKNIENKSIDKIVEFTKAGQELLLRIDQSPKLVIAVIDGLALGGGAELALAADVRLMTERGAIGFPETGIGIYPGLAGTQRLPRLIGAALAKYLIFTGDIINAQQAQAIGLAEYVPAGEVSEKIRLKVQGLRFQPGADQFQAGKVKGEKTSLMPAYEKIKNLFENNNNISDWLSGQAMETTDPSLARISKKVLSKAPQSLKLANQLIDEGLKTTLEAGIELELAHLPEIFSTRDAYEGLTSILQRRKPVFEGR